MGPRGAAGVSRPGGELRGAVTSYSVIGGQASQPVSCASCPRAHALPLPPPTDTIFACATAPGQAGIAVIRISGPRTLEALRVLGVAAPPPQRLRRARFLDPESNEPIDQGLVAVFPGPHSYTGETLAELHVHGSQAVLAALYVVLGRQPGLRLAAPGEF